MCIPWIATIFGMTHQESLFKDNLGFYIPWNFAKCGRISTIFVSKYCRYSAAENEDECYTSVIFSLVYFILEYLYVFVLFLWIEINYKHGHWKCFNAYFLN